MHECALLTIARFGHSNTHSANSDTHDPVQDKVLANSKVWASVKKIYSPNQIEKGYATKNEHTLLMTCTRIVISDDDRSGFTG